MPSELALLPINESLYRITACSNARAAGIWQLMPATAKAYGITINYWYDGRFNIIQSTTAALHNLQDLNREFHGDWLLVIAAYNGGSGRVEKAITYNRRHHLPTDFWDLKLPQETKTYVIEMLAIVHIIREHNYYGLQDVANNPYFKIINNNQYLTLNEIAKYTGQNSEVIYKLNSYFIRAYTQPKYWNKLLLPINSYSLPYIKSSFLTKFIHHKLIISQACYNHKNNTKYKIYIVRKGDNLSKIAMKYHTNINHIIRVNHLKNNIIYIKQRLKI